MSTNKAKLEKFEEFMAGDHALVHLDTRKPGVQVPESISGNYALTLKMSYLFQGETKADENGITVYLKFSGNYSECNIPWEAVWGLSSADGVQITWPEDLPKELVLQLAKEQLSKLKQKLFGKKEKQEQPAPDTSEPTPKPQKEKGGHLKRVK